MNNTVFITRTPIHGYTGQGYGSCRHREKKHDTLEEAVTSKIEFDWAYQVSRSENLSLDHDEDRYREATDHISYSIQGPTEIIKRTTIDEKL